MCSQKAGNKNIQEAKDTIHMKSMWIFNHLFIMGGGY